MRGFPHHLQYLDNLPQLHPLRVQGEAVVAQIDVVGEFYQIFAVPVGLEHVADWRQVAAWLPVHELTGEEFARGKYLQGRAALISTSLFTAHIE